MKYLKTYKDINESKRSESRSILFKKWENIALDIKDIFLELKDQGYSIEVRVGSNGGVALEMRQYKKDLQLSWSEFKDVVIRFLDYVKIENIDSDFICIFLNLWVLRFINGIWDWSGFAVPVLFDDLKLSDLDDVKVQQFDFYIQPKKNEPMSNSVQI